MKDLIIRKIPNKNITPLFTIIRKKSLTKEKMQILIKRIINIWLQLAKKHIFLEFHTQNILVDNSLNIYYRDLSDIRSIEYDIKPSYKINENDLMALSFDKTLCEQNIDHILRYDTELDRAYIKDYIKKQIKKYKLDFPNYSLGQLLH